MVLLFKKIVKIQFILLFWKEHMKVLPSNQITLTLEWIYNYNIHPRNLIDQDCVLFYSCYMTTFVCSAMV